MPMIPVDVYVFRLFRHGQMWTACGSTVAIGATAAIIGGLPWLGAAGLVVAVAAYARGRKYIKRARRMVAGSLPH